MEVTGSGRWYQQCGGLLKDVTLASSSSKTIPWFAPLPKFGPAEARVSGLCHGGGLAAPQSSATGAQDHNGWWVSSISMSASV